VEKAVAAAATTKMNNDALLWHSLPDYKSIWAFLSARINDAFSSDASCSLYLSRRSQFSLSRPSGWVVGWVGGSKKVAVISPILLTGV
jgi:hypothetical protein